jgi:hypothetical protein
MTDRCLLTQTDLRDFARSLKACFTILLIIQAMAIVGLIELLN